MEEIKLKIPPVEIPKHYEGEGGFNGGGKHWDSATLWEASKDLEEFDLPLIALNLDIQPWSITNFRWLLYHIKRIESCDLKYPVLLDPDGCIADGYHRIAKAILNGDLTIKAKRFSIMPEPDRTETD